MADLYFVSGGLTDQWNDVNNWSTSSGGAGGHALPTKTDDVHIDVNSPNTVKIGATGSSTSPVCRNLTVDTGFAINISYTLNFRLTVWGALNLLGTAGNVITWIQGFTYGSGGGLYLKGTCGTISHVNATKIRSTGGVRIVYDPLSCTIVNCPFWIDHTPVTRHISTVSDLKNMKDNLNDNFILDNDIDLTGVTDWVPLGTNIIAYDINGVLGSFTIENPFTGTFDGQGFTISNLTFVDALFAVHYRRGYAGLFGATGSLDSMAATIQNLNCSNFNITGYLNVAGLIGYQDSVLINKVKLSSIALHGVSGFNDFFGGFIGYGNGYTALHTQVLNSTLDGFTINGSNEISNVGGIMGTNNFENTSIEVTITNCLVTNFNVNSAGTVYGCGGLVGEGGGLVYGCFASVIINSNNEYLGGLFGAAYGADISKCYTEGSITGPDFGSGGFIGEFGGGSIKDCYSRVNVSATNDPSWIGGFIGDVYSYNGTSSINNCYASGTVTANGDASEIGGFIGHIQLNDIGFSLDIQNCYSVGIVTSTGTVTGGFLGDIYINHTPADFKIFNCAWYTGSSAHAIGIDYNGDSNKSLTDEGYGTDEPDNKKFYSKTHPVYNPVLVPDLEDEAGNSLLDEQGNTLLEE